MTMRQRVLQAYHLTHALVRRIQDHDLAGAAGELAYRLFLALFPFFIFVAALGSFVAHLFGVNDPTQSIMNLLGDSLPPDASSVLESELRNVLGARSVGLLSIGFVGAIWAASSGVATLMKAMNRSYGVRETRPLPQRWAISLLLTLLGGGALIALFILLVVGQLYGVRLATSIGLAGPAPYVLAYARLPLVVLCVLAALAVLYWATPNVGLPFHWLSPGSAAFSLAWLLLTYLFGVYVGHFGSYDATYGTLGGVVVLMLWFYLTGFLLLIGAELNAFTYEKAPQPTAPATASELPVPASRPMAVALPSGALPVLLGAALALVSWRPLRRRDGHDSA